MCTYAYTHVIQSEQIIMYLLFPESGSGSFQMPEWSVRSTGECSQDIRIYTTCKIILYVHVHNMKQYTVKYSMQ